METVIKTLIYIHAFFGGIGLLAGTAILFAKKGNQLHTKMGKIFSIGMLISSFLSFFICCFPNHHNPFLITIGIFTVYMILIGNNVLKYKRKNYQNKMDRVISGIMLFTSFMMICYGVYPLLTGKGLGILYIIFGALGAFMCYKDFVFYKDSENYKRWTMAHVGRMVGAYIASVTAFIVAGLGYGGNVTAWIFPTIIGTIYIIYWGRKLNKKVVVN